MKENKPLKDLQEILNSQEWKDLTQKEISLLLVIAREDNVKGINEVFFQYKKAGSCENQALWRVINKFETMRFLRLIKDQASNKIIEYYIQNDLKQYLKDTYNYHRETISKYSFVGINSLEITLPNSIHDLSNYTTDIEMKEDVSFKKGELYTVTGKIQNGNNITLKIQPYLQPTTPKNNKPTLIGDILKEQYNK